MAMVLAGRLSRLLMVALKEDLEALPFGVANWEIRAYQIGQRVKAAGLIVTGLCRTPYITGREAGTEDEIKGSIDMAAALGPTYLLSSLVNRTWYKRRC